MSRINGHDDREFARRLNPTPIHPSGQPKKGCLARAFGLGLLVMMALGTTALGLAGAVAYVARWAA